MRIGPVTLGSIDEWMPTPGAVVSWEPSPASIATAQEAPVSAVPVSYMQGQHIRGYNEQAAKGLDYSHLVISTWTLPGQCDIRAMGYVINAHLRRHDTYQSWFETIDTGQIVRHTIADPASIQFVPRRRGQMSQPELRDLIVATPGPTQWDCFRFGVIQAADSYTVYVSVDHLNMDAMFLAVVLMEFHAMYGALASGGAPLALPDAGSYDDYCLREDEVLSALTLESPAVRVWTEFAADNGGSFPDFPLPLGDPAAPCVAAVHTETLMTELQMSQFESACVAAGGRFIGGVLAAAGLAEHELTGSQTYHALTPSDTRRGPADFMTAGWFTGLVPITVPLTGSFADVCRTAQASFDSGTYLAGVPFYRVLELAPSLSWPRPNYPVVNFFDAGAPPLSALLTADLEGLNVGIYTDGRYSYQMSLFVVRLKTETAAMVVYPDNPEARESVARYVAAMKAVCARVAREEPQA